MSIRTSICGLSVAYETILLVDVVRLGCRKTVKRNEEKDFDCIWSNVDSLEILVEYEVLVLPKQAVDSNEWNETLPYRHSMNTDKRIGEVLLNSSLQWYTKGV